MTDFAPFVAAALRDKTIHELMEENKKLREQLMAVEVTGSQGQPVYARGKFDEDGDYHENPDMWNVKFSEQVTPCPLSELKYIEIWIGGSIRASFDTNIFSNSWEILDDRDYDEGDDNEEKSTHAQEKVLSVCFQPGIVWLSINIGWSDEELLEENLHLPDNSGEIMLNHICENLSRANHSKVCKFKDVSPTVASVKKLLKSIPSANDPEILERKRRDTIYQTNFIAVLDALENVLGRRFTRMSKEARLHIVSLYHIDIEDRGIDFYNEDAVLNYIANNMQEGITVENFILNSQENSSDEE